MDDLFVDAYAISTGLKQRIPRHWLDDPILGRDFRMTPSQRELDGELPPRPPGDAKGPEIAEFAEAAGIDLSGIKTNDDKLVAIEEAFGSAPVQAGLVEVDVSPVAPDPLAPELVAFVDGPARTDGVGDSAVEDYAGDDWTFQALKDEIDKRNAGREDDAHLSKGGSADDLRARLVEDDAAQAAESGDGTTDETSTDMSTGDTTESPDETPAAGDKE